MEPLRTSEHPGSTAPHDPRRVDPALREKYDVRGPRYTSYPPANHFDEIDRGELLRRWRERTEATDDPGLSIYVHIPFCESRCLYCACHSFVCQDRGPAEEYVDGLIREMDLAAPAVGPDRPVRQVALGGGTPNYLSAEALEKLLLALEERWDLRPEAERSVEIDPRSVTVEQLDLLLRHGFRRFSLGVQDFDRGVLSKVERRQGGLEVEQVVAGLRERGCRELNFDLIYGLPGQSRETAERTALHVLALQPSRVALYSYAHVPWIKPHQKVLEERGLPPPELKAEIFWTVADRLLAAGYRAIGMDHFALPHDPLSRALRDRTVGRGLDVIGLGASAISSIGSTYAQNTKELAPYMSAVGSGELPIVRGHLLSFDDELRRELLLELFCTFEADLSALSRRFGLDLSEHLAEDLERLEPMVADGLVDWDPRRIRVTPKGRFFIRNICMTFDKYLERDRAQRAYSRTV